eukprot:3221011-Rhodomonas_salina.1
MFPITHCGRAVASIAAVAGLLMAALTTASMWSALNRTQEEESALNMLKRFQVTQLCARSDMGCGGTGKAENA